MMENSTDVISVTYIRDFMTQNTSLHASSMIHRVSRYIPVTSISIHLFDNLAKIFPPGNYRHRGKKMTKLPQGNVLWWLHMLALTKVMLSSWLVSHNLVTASRCADHYTKLFDGPMAFHYSKHKSHMISLTNQDSPPPYDPSPWPHRGEPLQGVTLSQPSNSLR